MANVASAAEVRAAQAFLRYVGAPSTDNHLILAVVAWFRQESGSLAKVIGNNPFNIRPGVASKLSNGVRKSSGNGYFLTFSTLDQGFEAAALVLKSLAPSYGYGLVLSALRRGDPIDFLVALAMSSWDAGHYGVTARDNPADVRANHLLRVYAGFTGLILPTPKPTQPKPVPGARALPPLPTVLQPPPPAKRDYLDGFAARSFYADRHRRPGTLDSGR
jgi:hypothetical protein